MPTDEINFGMDFLEDGKFWVLHTHPIAQTKPKYLLAQTRYFAVYANTLFYLLMSTHASGGNNEHRIKTLLAKNTDHSSASNFHRFGLTLRFYDHEPVLIMRLA